LAALSNPVAAVAALGYTAVTSPAMIYAFAQATGSIRAIKSMGVDKLA
jgi:hypothetical protein